MNRQVPIGEANATQLRAFAANTLGFTMPGNTKIETIRAKISAAWDKDYILVPEDESPPAFQEGQSPNPVTRDQAPVEPKKVKIIINLTEDVGGDQPVLVGVNGSVMLIPRGKEVDIPLPYFEVLKNAVAHKYEMMPDGQSLNPSPRLVPLYPYQVLQAAA